MTRKSIILILFYTFLCARGPDAVWAGPLKIGIMPFAPFLIVDGGKIGGTELERLKTVLDSQGIEYSVAGFPPKRLYQYIGTGEVDLALSAKFHPLYEKAIIHSRKPITNIELQLFAHKRVPLPRSREDWIGKAFILINGYGYAGFLAQIEELEQQQRITVYRNSKHENAVQMLAAMRADYLLDYKMPTSIAIEALDLADELQAKTIYKVDIYVLLNRKVKNARQLLDAIERGYELLAP